MFGFIPAAETDLGYSNGTGKITFRGTYELHTGLLSVGSRILFNSGLHQANSNRCTTQNQSGMLGYVYMYSCMEKLNVSHFILGTKNPHES